MSDDGSEEERELRRSGAGAGAKKKVEGDREADSALGVRESSEAGVSPRWLVR